METSAITNLIFDVSKLAMHSSSGVANVQEDLLPTPKTTRLLVYFLDFIKETFETTVIVFSDKLVFFVFLNH